MELDRVAKSVDRYGFASISTPFLAGGSDEFDFDLKKSAEYYFNQAFNPEGAVRQSAARALDVQGSFRINIEQALAAVAQYRRAQTVRQLRDARDAASIALAGIEGALRQSLTSEDDANSGDGDAAPASSTIAMSDDPEIRIQGLLTILGAAEQDAVAVMLTPEQRVALGALVGVLGRVTEIDPETEALPGFVPTTQPVAGVQRGPEFTDQMRAALSTVGRDFTTDLGFPEQAFKISPREALAIAHGDVTTQALLRWFMRPFGNKLGGYELYYCPIIVSVQPGWETRENYQADVTVHVDLAREVGGELEFLSEKFPDASPPIQVAGVFPLIDSQVLDLVASRRRLFAAAFQLASLGFGREASFFADYAEKLESDAQTATALTAASAYTLGSTGFGFRVEPKFVALDDPTAPLGLATGRPGDRLESKTFPALAAVLVHRSYLRSRTDVFPRTGSTQAEAKDSNCVCNKPNSAKSWEEQINAGGSAFAITKQYRVSTNARSQCNCRRSCAKCRSRDKEEDKYDFLIFRTSTRWSPNKARPFGGRYSEVEGWKRAEALDKAEDWVDSKQYWLFCDKLKCHKELFYGKVPYGRQRAHLSSRIQALQRMALDSQALVRVFHNASTATKVVVQDVFPQVGWLDKPTVVTITGKGFDSGNVSYVTVGGVQCRFRVESDTLLRVIVPPWGPTTNEKPSGEFASAVAVSNAELGASTIVENTDNQPGAEEDSPPSRENHSGATREEFWIEEDQKLLAALVGKLSNDLNNKDEKLLDHGLYAKLSNSSTSSRSARRRKRRQPRSTLAQRGGHRL